MSSPICNQCSQQIDRDDESYMVCKENHFYHKACIKLIYKNHYHEKLDAGYIYSAGTNKYKKHKCKWCGLKLKVYNSIFYKMKKVAKAVALAPVVALLVIIL